MGEAHSRYDEGIFPSIAGLYNQTGKLDSAFEDCLSRAAEDSKGLVAVSSYLRASASQDHTTTRSTDNSLARLKEDSEDFVRRYHQLVSDSDINHVLPVADVLVALHGLPPLEPQRVVRRHKSRVGSLGTLGGMSALSSLRESIGDLVVRTKR